MKTITSFDGHPVKIITHRASVLEYLRGLLPELRDVPCIAHAEPDDVRQAVIIGSVPYHLARWALLTIELPLRLSQDDRTKLLTLDDVRQRARPLRAYQVLPQGWSYRTECPKLPRSLCQWLDSLCRRGILERV